MSCACLPWASTSQPRKSTEKSSTSILEIRIKAVKSAQPRSKFQQNLSFFFQIPVSLSYPLAPQPFWYPPKPHIPTSHFLPPTASLLVQSPVYFPPCTAWDMHWTVILGLAIRSQSEVVEGETSLLGQTIKPAQFFPYKTTLMKNKIVTIVCKQRPEKQRKLERWSGERKGRKWEKMSEERAEV